jgi:hypothetical protein
MRDFDPVHDRSGSIALDLTAGRPCSMAGPPPKPDLARGVAACRDVPLAEVVQLRRPINQL